MVDDQAKGHDQKRTAALGPEFYGKRLALHVIVQRDGGNGQGRGYETQKVAAADHGGMAAAGQQYQTDHECCHDGNATGLGTGLGMGGTLIGQIHDPDPVQHGPRDQDGKKDKASPAGEQSRPGQVNGRCQWLPEVHG